MRLSPETEAEVVRLHHAEKWPVGTIATQLGIHHTTVQRVLREAGLPRTARPHRPSIADPFLPFIVETLERYPKLPSSRLFVMARERGYPGTSDGHFRRIVARHRPRKPAEAYLRLQTLPGEQAQVDWGHFGKVPIGDALRPLMAFVMVLSWSRRIFVRFFFNQRMESFLAGHVAAFDAFGGVPRVLLYDNLKSAVLERRGDAIRFHPTLLSLAGHYRFEPRPVAVARGNEKGRVERAIRYMRTSFFAAREWTDLATLNAEAEAWCLGLASERPCPEQEGLTVGAAFEQEREHLLELPGDAFPADHCQEARVGKTPYVRFDLNDYSVPHTHVRRTLTLRATPERVRILDGIDVVADHRRSYGRRERVEEPAHIEALTAVKREAREHRGMDRLRHAVHNAHDLLLRAAERGHNLGSVTAGLLRLLEHYGPAEVEAGIAEALAADVPHPQAVRTSIERRREARSLPATLPIRLPDDPRVRHVAVRPHDLTGYDRIGREDR